MKLYPSVRAILNRSNLNVSLVLLMRRACLRRISPRSALLRVALWAKFVVLAAGIGLVAAASGGR